MNCKHCYTYDIDLQSDDLDTKSIVDKISDQSCDVIYVSQRYENFYDEGKGYQLCNELYVKYHKDILIITRSYLSDSMINQLHSLSNVMQKEGHNLYIAVSICANKSYGVTEDPNICPTPLKRLSNLQRAHICGIKTILILRPIFPNEIIPVVECTSLISQFADSIDAVVTSGLIATDGILKRLCINKDDLSFIPSGDSTYLADLRKEEVLYLDVEDELQTIEHQCSLEKIPCFRHSMPALNYIANK